MNYAGHIEFLEGLLTIHPAPDWQRHEFLEGLLTIHPAPDWQRHIRAAIDLMRAADSNDLIQAYESGKRDALREELEKLETKLSKLRVAAERVLDSWDTDDDVNESHLALRAAVEASR